MPIRKNISIRQLLGSRSNQQDCYGFRSSHFGSGPMVVAVADGMGGHAGGEVASRLAIETFLESFDAKSGSSISGDLKVHLAQANAALVRRTMSDPTLQGMGSTLVAAALARRSLYWISVGDSPLWLFRKGTLLRLNKDHSARGILKEKLENGDPDASGVRPELFQNSLYSYLGDATIAMIDCPQTPLALQHGDWVMLATDGIDTLSTDDIANILKRSSNVRSATRGLVAGVEKRKAPNQDNVTVAVWNPLPRMPLIVGIAMGIALLLAGAVAWNLPALRQAFAPPKPAPASRLQSAPPQAASTGRGTKPATTIPIPTPKPRHAKKTTAGAHPHGPAKSSGPSAPESPSPTLPPASRGAADPGTAPMLNGH